MDSSKIAALGSPKPPTIASRRPMLSSQRSFSVLSINTSTTHGDMLRRNSSATTANRHRRLQTPTNVPPLPLSANSGSNMSPEELSSKIADSFQQFSSMLSQLSSNKPVPNPTATPVTPPLNNTITHPITVNKTKSINNQSKKQQFQKPLSPPLQNVSPKVIPSPTRDNTRKVLRPALSSTDISYTKKDQIHDTLENVDNQLPQPRTINDTESESDEDINIEEYNSHAIYYENALKNIAIPENAINEGNTRLRQRLISKWLTRAASIGDLDTMQKMIHSIKDIDINCTDDKRSGISPLMYAAYFGQEKCLLYLLKQPGIQVNLQDKKGWTALMWAINSHQVEIVEILLKHGAEKNLETRYGRTIYDYSTSTGVKQILGSPPPPPLAAVLAIDRREEKLKIGEKNVLVPGSNTGETTTRGNSTTGDVDYYQTAVNGYGHFLESHGNTTNVDSKKKHVLTTATKTISPPDFSQLTKATTSPQQEQKNKEIILQNNRPITPMNDLMEEDELKRWESSIKSSNTFSWNQCLPDQMFVFSQDDLPLILDQALSVTDTKSLMNMGQLSNELWRPANIIFLSTRFVHYCSSRDLLNILLSSLNVKLSRIIKAYSRDMHTLAYWIANICQLTSYLKKDPGLSVSTCEAQENLSALVSEAYSYFITEAQKRIERILEPAMMDYESIHELEQVDFVDDWQRFFRRSSTNYSRKSIDTVSSVDGKLSIDSTSTTATSTSAGQNETASSSSDMSPHSITSLLTSIQSILQAYYVPPAIVIQAMAQFFHYLSCELFNRVLTYKKYICRSKALQLRMNLSAMEEWVRKNHLPSSLNNAFEPLVQLLQLLQCLSQMDDIILFSSTVQTFDKLNPLQVKRCVQNYRYEVSEQHLPEAVEQLASQMVLDHQQQRLMANENRRNSNGSINHVIQTRASLDSMNSSKTNFIAAVSSRGGGRPASISSLNCLLSTTTNKKRLSTEDMLILNSNVIQQLDDEEEEDHVEEEKRNSKYVLPFSIPITTALLQDWTDEKHKKSKHDIDEKSNYSDAIYQEIKLKKQEQLDLLDKIYPTIPEEWLYHLDKRLYKR